MSSLNIRTRNQLGMASGCSCPFPTPFKMGIMFKCLTVDTFKARCATSHTGVHGTLYNAKKRKFQGSDAKSNTRKGFLMYEELRKYLTIYKVAVSHK